MKQVGGSGQARAAGRAFGWRVADQAWPAYLLAAVVGLLLAGWVVPLRLAAGRAALSAPAFGDTAQHIVAQRYFIADSWHWPPLRTTLIMPPAGANLGLMDGIPLEAVVLKLLRPVLPPGFQGIWLWVFLCWALQPAAAVFALRGAGERRLLPAAATMVLAASLPAFALYGGEGALSAHFILLLGLGLYLRLVAWPAMIRPAMTRPALARAALIWAPPLAFLVHPYLAAMLLPLLAAAPLTLLLRGDRDGWRTGAAFAAGVLATWAIGAMLGYAGTSSPGGYGYYSMNLLAPFQPAMSSFFGPGTIPDGTGGQGFDYLGLGLLALLAAACCCAPRRVRAGLRRHPGLALACAALTLLAVSTQVCLGRLRLLDLGHPALLQQVRASERFFWPVAYALLVGAAVAVSRAGRAGQTVLACCALLQFAETRTLRDWLRADVVDPGQWAVDAAAFRRLFATQARLVLWPTVGCGADQNSAGFLHLLLLASEAGLPVNTMEISRTGPGFACPSPDAVRAPLAPGELLVLLPSAPAGTLLAVPDWQQDCRLIGALRTCSLALRDRADLPVPEVPALPLGRPLAVAEGAPGAAALAMGWSHPEAWGTWSDGRTAELIFRLDRPVQGAVQLTLGLNAFVPRGRATQHVTLTSDGAEVASLDVAPGAPQLRRVSVPVPTPRDRLDVELHIGTPAEPAAQDAGSMDHRALGVGLTTLSVTDGPG